MKVVLNDEQLRQIDRYLNAKRITYIDFKFEIFDHIASEIESRLAEGTDDFDTAFYEVQKKWNHHFQRDTSWLFGICFNAPAIVLKRAAKVYRPFHAMLLLIAFGGPFLSYYFNIQFSPITSDTLLYFGKPILALCFVIWVFGTVKTLTDKVKTTYTFLIKTQVLSILYLPILWSMQSLNQTYSLTLVVAFIYTSGLVFYLANKHSKEKEKFALD